MWTHSQGVYNLRRDLALALGLSPESVGVQHVEGAGCYGHNGADDVALDAALLARAVPGRHVKLQWMRGDEFGWAPYGPAMRVQLRAALDDLGRIVDWQHEFWSSGHSSRPGRGAMPTQRPSPTPIPGSTRWPDPRCDRTPPIAASGFAMHRADT